ncbi:MAG: T9SS type A sorting domain-containing protein [Muribaculaceae bacterium]|nr:T9SS type A sorting domain-containing protein [Muribaculaceae bacterium]
MKKVFSFVLMAIIGLSMYATDNLYVRHEDGDTRISISSIKEITFPSGQVVVAFNDGTSKTYSTPSFISLRFNGNVGSGVESAMADDTITLDGVVVKSSHDGIAVYSTDGRLVAASESAEVNVSSLASGIYIVKSGSLTSKIVK